MFSGSRCTPAVIADPPKGHLPYFIMDDTFLEAAACTSEPA
jgi:hypothetical protein